MAKNNISCPICSALINRGQWFYSCTVCNTLSLFPRIGSPVNKEQALDNLARVIKNRLEAMMPKQVVRQEPELNIVVKTVFDDCETLDGIIINVNGCTFPYYIEEAF